ncbi:MAG: KUP/HAK/KT family potassium transporter, partial [Desulfobacterales bacterium]|nr:KUP/HAK/KT family potassium transporter [Desulfobacterales bacterium]
MVKQYNFSSKHRENSFFSSPTLLLALGSLGIVYGDIGTSPLYALRECFYGIYAVDLREGNILGVLSLVFWSLTMVISIKYVVFIMRADYKRMGGIFALLALISDDRRKISPKLYSYVVFIAMIGAALLFGDGVITPAISVLSAVEGLGIATESAKPLIVPLTCLILVFLFFVQHRGAEVIGNIFGPIMVVWFITIAMLGLKEIMVRPDILRSINPIYAYDFFAANRIQGFMVLGAVVLCITGGEALYADMGHFGKNPIRISWFGLVFPSLLLNYFGQGALLLNNPNFVINPFYGLVPKSLMYPMVCLSTIATIIASQAMISGIFSLTQQAIQLGFFPKMQIIHTSRNIEGQVYIPQINYIMMVISISLVLLFKRSGGLAGAYGIAVTADMALTSILYFFVINRIWKIPFWQALSLLFLFLSFDISYFSANLPKIFDGGWVTLAIAAIIVTAMIFFRDDREAIKTKILKPKLVLDAFLEDIAKNNPPRIQGTAVFMSTSAVGLPKSLLNHLKYNSFLHENIVILFTRLVDTPNVSDWEKVEIEELGHNFYRIFASYGFKEKPDIPLIMYLASFKGLSTDPATTIYYMSKGSIA